MLGTEAIPLLLKAAPGENDIPSSLYRRAVASPRSCGIHQLIQQMPRQHSLSRCCAGGVVGAGTLQRLPSGHITFSASCSTLRASSPSPIKQGSYSSQDCENKVRWPSGTVDCRFCHHGPAGGTHTGLPASPCPRASLAPHLGGHKRWELVPWEQASAPERH